MSEQDQHDDVVAEVNELLADEFEPARFESRLELPSGEPGEFADAAVAVRQEYRDGSSWKRLECRKVSVFAERDRGAIYVVDVGSSVEFDWTWEGATAFRPHSLDDDPRDSDRVYEQADYKDEIQWSGEVVEVDESNGCLFISLDDPERVPSVGPFFVRPFEFLAVLHKVYTDPEYVAIEDALASRLKATQGNVHPRVVDSSLVGLPELRAWWQYSWSVLWGPPGTGKTFTIGRQIAKALNDRRERILVVSTTNRATDAVALSIGRAAREFCPKALSDETLVRIGKGASYQSFLNERLEQMLRGSESETLSQIDQLAQQLPLFDSWEDKALTRKQIGELKAANADRSHRLFVDPGKRVVIATAFKAISYLRDETIHEMIENGEAPFTTVLVDEAGLIPRATLAALSLLAARRVVLVGDSKQLAPISRIARILPSKQQTWLGSSGLTHLDSLATTPKAVHLISQQHRMHPDVCSAVSQFQYDGLLTTAADRADQKSSLTPFIADFSRTIWYALDHETQELAAIRASRGPGNQSWVRSVTASVLKKLFSNEEVRSTQGLFISPFKAQARAIAELLSQWGMSHWEASTVHSQQGSEADLVVFDTVNAGSYNWPYDEWKRLVNVALSRAREAVIVLASRDEMEEPYLKPLLAHLTPAILVNKGDTVVWQPCELVEDRRVQVAEPQSTYRASPRPAVNRQGVLGGQFAQRKSLKPVLSQEQQRIADLSLDGKPRLVRGVAGSGKSVVLCNWLAKTAQRFCEQGDSRIWAVYANRSLHKLLRESTESAWKHLHETSLLDRPSFPWHLVSLIHVKDVLAGLLPSASLSIGDFGFDYDRAAEAFLERPEAAEVSPRCDALFIDEAQDMGPSTLRLLLSLVEQSDANDPNSRSAFIFYDNAQNIYGTKTPKWSDYGLDMRGRSMIMRESYRATRPITELAVNVLNRLTPDHHHHDRKELISLSLLTPIRRNGRPWLKVKFNQVDGPKPFFHCQPDRESEIDEIAKHVRVLVEQEAVSPEDICMIFNGNAETILQNRLAPKLAQFGVELSIQKSRPYQRNSNTLVATTAHSYKGYESEVVMIPCVDHFVAREGKVLANSLYVAMTRARSLLAIYGIPGRSQASYRLCQTIQECLSDLSCSWSIDPETTL